MPSYFVNDVVCRVRTRALGGTEIDIGTVDYPSNICCDPSGAKETLEDLVTNGYGEGWEFWVTWGHHNSTDYPTARVKREKVNASDDTLFLLNRPFSRGMYVRRINDPTSIGIVKDLETTVHVQNTVGSVISYIDLHDLEFNWISENMLGKFVTLEGWIGQIVEVDKEATVQMERDSRFQLLWTERLNEFEFLKEKHMFPEEWESVEPHLRFRAVGDMVMLTAKELSQVKWSSSPSNKSWVWHVYRPYQYAGKPGEVNMIGVNEVVFNWMKRLPVVPPEREKMGQKPADRWRFDTVSGLVKRNGLRIVSCVNPEDKGVGSPVYVVNSVVSTLSTATYDKWARVYLQDLHDRNLQTRDEPGRAKKMRPGINIDQRYVVTGVGKLEGSVGRGANVVLREGEGSEVTSNGSAQSIPGHIIAQSSTVAVKFSAFAEIECVNSTELVPVYLNETLKYPLGSLVHIGMAELGVELRPGCIYYGIVLRYLLSSGEEDGNFVAVKIFSMSHETVMPVLEREALLTLAQLRPHLTLNMRPGDLVIRGCVYDDFVAGTFLQGLDTGYLLVATGDGLSVPISPCRVVTFKFRSVRVSILDTWKVDGLCCAFEKPPTADMAVSSELWVGDYDMGESLNGLKKLVSLRNPNPSPAVLAFWDQNKFVPYDGKHLQLIKIQRSHHYEGEEYNPDKKDMYMQIMDDNLKLLDPNSFWMKVDFDRYDLIFGAMVGPVGSLYEDILFLFDIRIPPVLHGGADIYFNSFFEYDVIPDTGEEDVCHLIPFSWRTGTQPTQNCLENCQNVNYPYLAAFFKQIQGRNMQAEPVNISSYFGDTMLGSLFTCEAKIKLINQIYVRTELIRYIARQILNPPLEWYEEILSFYKTHLPKFFFRQLAWVTGHTSNSSGAVIAKRTDLLENLHELMFIYNKLL